MSLTPLGLTLQLIAVSVAIAAAMGIVGAWAAAVLRSAGWVGRTAAACFLFSMVAVVATPLVLHATAWEATAGKFGWATMTQTGVRGDPAGAYGWFRGLLASGWIHGAFGSAIVALATWFGTERTDAAISGQSELDFGPIARWWKVRLPIAAPWVIAALIATALIAASEMTVVDLYGYETIADRFYLYNAVDPSAGQILWTCIVPMSLAAALLVWLGVARRRRFAVQMDRVPVGTDRPAPATTLLCLLTVIVVLAAVALVPLAGLIIKIGHVVIVHDGTIEASWSAAAGWEHLVTAPRLFIAEYVWTGTIGFATGIVSVLVAWPLAMYGRRHRLFGQWADVATVLIFAIPGPVVGLLIVRMFQWPIPGFRFLYGQTILPLVMALAVRSVPVAYWILRTGYRGVSDRVFDAAMLDLTALGRLWRVDGPLISRYLGFAVLAASVFASGDVPATLPVIPPGVTTVGTRLFELLHSGARYQEASLAIWYVGFVVLMAAAMVVGYPGRKR